MLLLCSSGQCGPCPPTSWFFGGESGFVFYCFHLEQDKLPVSFVHRWPGVIVLG